MSRITFLHMEQDLAKLKSEVDRLRPSENDTSQISERVEAGSAAVDVPQRANPWLSGAGMFRDDPLFDDWQRAIAEYRREVDRIADAP